MAGKLTVGLIVCVFEQRRDAAFTIRAHLLVKESNISGIAETPTTLACDSGD
jgi:hypothetical protein